MTKTLNSATLVAIVVLGLPLLAHAAQKAPSVLEDERLEGVRAEMVALFMQVEEAGLPVALFEAKVREGLVKKVEPAKILSALGKLEERCSKAMGLIEKSGMKPTASSVGYTAELMQLGVGEEDAARLLDGLSKADAALLEKGLIVTIMMREQGVAGPEAVDRVLAIVEKGGKKGLDTWLESTSKKGSKDKDGKKKSKTKKSKKGPKKSSGKAKAPGKSPKSHGK